MNVALKHAEWPATQPANVACLDRKQLATMHAIQIQFCIRRFYLTSAIKNCHPFFPRVSNLPNAKWVSVKNVCQFVRTSKSS